MIFTLIVITSFLINLFFLIKLFKNLLNIEDKTYNELQNYLQVSKPDKLFKRYYDSMYKHIEPNNIKNQIITIEFNENYINYHAGKACMSDIINNLNYTFKDLMVKSEEPKLILMNNNKWKLSTKSKNISLDKINFENIAINFHINYIDLKHIAKTVKRSDLDLLTNNFKSLLNLNNSQYIVYDIYNNEFKNELINVKTWSDYITFALNYHFALINKNKANNINEIITKFNKISKKYNWIFDDKDNVLYLYNVKNGELALPNPDGLIINCVKMV